MRNGGKREQHDSLILEQVSDQWQANDRAAAIAALPWAEQTHRRRRYALNAMLAIAIIATVIFTAAAAIGSAVTYDERIAQTVEDGGLGGLDRFLEEISTEAVLVLGLIAVLVEWEIYHDLKYFLLANKHSAVKTAVNKICGVLAALAALPWLIPLLIYLVGVLIGGGTYDPGVFGVMWLLSPVCFLLWPVVRLVGGIICLITKTEKEEETIL